MVVSWVGAQIWANRGSCAQGSRPRGRLVHVWMCGDEPTQPLERSEWAAGERGLQAAGRTPRMLPASCLACAGDRQEAQPVPPQKGQRVPHHRGSALPTGTGPGGGRGLSAETPPPGSGVGRMRRAPALPVSGGGRRRGEEAGRGRRGAAGWRGSSRSSTGCRTPSRRWARAACSTCRRSRWWAGRAPARAPCWRTASPGEAAGTTPPQRPVSPSPRPARYSRRLVPSPF